MATPQSLGRPSDRYGEMVLFEISYQPSARRPAIASWMGGSGAVSGAVAGVIWMETSMA